MSPSISGPEVDEELKGRTRFLTIFVFFLFAILLLRLVHMQIFKGSYYDSLSQNNRIRMVSVKAPRGKIVDRNGVVLADNRPSYDLMVLPEDVPDIEGTASRIGVALDTDPSEIREMIHDGLSRPYNPVYVARDITFDQVARIETDIFNLPGVSIDASTERDYVYKDLACHTLGFVGEISRRELRKSKDENYSPGDLIGKNGIELSCEDTLRGEKGSRVFEVDAVGRKISVLDERPPAAGREVRLTIDSRLQTIARDALGERAGAVVAMDPFSGEILAMVSRPGFDPNIFMTPMAPEIWKQIIDDPLHPLENRALRGQYPPGSIFKVPVAIAGLSSGRITPETALDCPGSYSLGTHTYRCWKIQGHGPVRLERAIAESCDVYFYKLGEMLGIDLISGYSREMGFGRPTGIELGDELSGLIPTREWKQRRFGKSWHPGETIISAIGQGFVLVTPIQVAKGISVAINGGKLMTPKVLVSTIPNVEKTLDVDASDLETVKEGLRAVVESPHGTGRRIRDPMFSIGGKSGTAQVARGYKSSKLPDESDLPYNLRDHAWFFGFSPVETPEILVVVVVEHGGHGGSIAAPIASDVIKGYYFLKGISDEPVYKDNR